MEKQKRIYKFGTGDVIPEGAVYLSTQIEKTISIERAGNTEFRREDNKLVWHYFLVEVELKDKEK